jgi:lipopolysaccharide export system permease protein
MINDERNPKKKTTVSAESGVIIYTEKGPRIMLVNGTRQEIDTKNSQFSSLSFDQYSVDFGSTQNKKRKHDSVRSKTLKELLFASQDKNLTPAEARRYIVEGNRRLISPFYNLLFSIIACTGLLVGNFNRRGQTKIISASILAMIIIEANDLIFGNMSTKHLYFLPLYYVNLLLPLAVCLYALLLYNPTWFARLRKKGAVA